jgi:hypothetical protein
MHGEREHHERAGSAGAGEGPSWDARTTALESRLLMGLRARVLVASESKRAAGQDAFKSTAQALGANLAAELERLAAADAELATTDAELADALEAKDTLLGMIGEKRDTTDTTACLCLSQCDALLCVEGKYAQMLSLQHKIKTTEAHALRLAATLKALQDELDSRRLR